MEIKLKNLKQYMEYQKKRRNKALILTRKQEEALKIAVARYNNKEKYTCISGYA